MELRFERLIKARWGNKMLKRIEKLLFEFVDIVPLLHSIVFSKTAGRTSAFSEAENAYERNTGLTLQMFPFRGNPSPNNPDAPTPLVV